MTTSLSDWTVLITARQTETQAPITDGRSRRILEILGREDAWIQYPPASGRGHGFETRWWERGVDAASVSVSSIERYRAAVADVGLEIEVVLVHVASPEDRLNETTIGLERRASSPEQADRWNVMVRATAGASEGRFGRDSLERLMLLLPGSDSSGSSRDGLVEVRFWIDGADAVDAADRGAAAFSDAMASLGHAGWSIVRAHVTSVAEARRTAYLGVERRMRKREPASLPVAIHP